MNLLEDTVNTKRNWIRVTLFVALALTSLSSTATAAAMSAPHPSLLAVPEAADLCGETGISPWEQYVAAIEWAEQSGDMPPALSANCVKESQDRVASPSGSGVESWDPFEQYLAATESAEPEYTFTTAPFGYDSGYWEIFAQNPAAVESEEREPGTFAPFGYDSGYWERFAQDQE